MRPSIENHPFPEEAAGNLARLKIFVKLKTYRRSGSRVKAGTTNNCKSLVFALFYS